MEIKKCKGGAECGWKGDGKHYCYCYLPRKKVSKVNRIREEVSSFFLWKRLAEAHNKIHTNTAGAAENTLKAIKRICEE